MHAAYLGTGGGALLRVEVRNVKAHLGEHVVLPRRMSAVEFFSFFPFVWGGGVALYHCLFSASILATRLAIPITATFSVHSHIYLCHTSNRAHHPLCCLLTPLRTFSSLWVSSEWNSKVMSVFEASVACAMSETGISNTGFPSTLKARNASLPASYQSRLHSRLILSHTNK